MELKDIRRLAKAIALNMTGKKISVRFVKDSCFIGCCTSGGDRPVIKMNYEWIMANQNNRAFVLSLIVHELAHITAVPIEYANEDGDWHTEEWATECARWGARWETSHQDKAAYAFNIPPADMHLYHDNGYHFPCKYEPEVIIFE